MPSSLPPEAGCPRRAFLGAGLAGAAVVTAGLGPLQTWAAQDGDVAGLLRRGGVVAAFRHATAPGTFDPPGFQLGDCSTQRNLSPDGREQARRMGVWFRERSLQPVRVRSSPWCRCIDSATLAFSPPDVWAALGSPRGSLETTRQRHLGELRNALVQASARPGSFEAWFTHMFVLSDLAQADTASGEALLLRTSPLGRVEVLARLPAPA
jgi:hypothetical protein